MTTGNLHFKTQVFEGPLELLLELIEKRKLLINDVSLASVTEEYIARVNSMEHLPMGDTAQFVALAATLLLIKSRSLLPTLELTDDESRDIKELEYRLAVYQLVKESTRALTQALESPMPHEGRAPDLPPLFIPDESVTQDSLRAAARVLIEGFPTTLTLPKVAVKKVISLEDMIDRLRDRVAKAMSMSFREFSGGAKAPKHDVIVGFLALLELVKQGIINATQEDNDIRLEHDSLTTPTYE